MSCAVAFAGTCIPTMVVVGLSPVIVFSLWYCFEVRETKGGWVYPAIKFGFDKNK